MNWLDALLPMLGIVAGVAGYRLGFVTRAMSWALLAAGLFLGTWAVPKILRTMQGGSSNEQMFFAATTLLIVFAMLGQAIGLLIGSRMARRLHSFDARHRDQVGGAAAGVIGVVALIWIVAPVMSTVPGTPSRLARGSVVVQSLNRVLPNAPDVTRSLRALVGPVSPEVFTSGRRTESAGPVPASHSLSKEVVDRVVASTVRIEGHACATVQEGSGFVVGTDTVVTNAHVVAGEETTSIVTQDGRRLTGELVSFDPRSDVAFLRVPGLDLEPLTLTSAQIGSSGAVFGYPGGGPLAISPFRVSDSVNAVGRDIYDRVPIRRSVLILAVELEPGDSGAPLVNESGQVVGMAFAVAPDRSDVGYALQVSDLFQTNNAGAMLTAGSCLS